MQQSFDKIAFLILLFFISCTSIENNIDGTKKIDRVDITKIASEKFGEKFSLDYNKSKEFVICKNGNESNVAGNSPIEYFIYDVINNKMIEENVIPLGNISWVSKFEVKAEIYPGMIQKKLEPDIGYILNVKTNFKTKLNGGVH